MDAHQEQAPPPRSRNTSIAGELPLNEVGPPLPPRPAPQPSRMEVTQPYIPAIREQAPEFTKRLNPGTPSAPRPVPAAAPPPPQAPQAPPQPKQTAPRPAVQQPAPQPTQRAAPVTPAKRRSLARRVVRRILGPDLLRKDPPKQPKKR
jgi:hypothetical protein